MGAGGGDRLDTAPGPGVVRDLRDADDDAARMVPAAAIVDVVSGRTVSAPRALILRGAVVVGLLDLERVQIVCPLVLRACELAEPVNLSQAHALDVALVECQI